MDKGAKIEYNTLMRKNEEGVALVRKKSGFENLVLISQLGLNVLTAVFLCVAACGRTGSLAPALRFPF